MKISSVRLGHANNSSSMHSILIGCPCREDLNYDEMDGPYYSRAPFFHLVSVGEKMKYFAIQVRDALMSDMGIDTAVQVASEITGMDFSYLANQTEYGQVGCIDHKSRWSFPGNSVEFIKEFCAFIKRPDVTIRGGGDEYELPDNFLDGDENEKYVHPIYDAIADRYGSSDLAFRVDGEWTVLYNRRTGAKIRFSGNDHAPEYLASSLPELIDVKITDWCGHGCKFCYQGSTRAGEHAPLDRIKEIANACGRMGVFEVALGGGEPTAHPDFPAILRAFKAAGVTPNFTTFNMDFAENAESRAAVVECCGSFAVSSLDPKTLERVKEWNNDWDNRVKASVQVVMGGHPEDDVLRAISLFVRNRSTRLTFLGYKTTGRGDGFKRHPTGQVLSAIKYAFETQGFEFGADTLFVQENRGMLDAMGVSEKLRVGEEGCFSMYVDAVEQRIAPHSYGPTRTRLAVDMEIAGEFEDAVRDNFPFHHTD